jgi:glycosyltransferase involved in cell wall biosynthesis
MKIALCSSIVPFRFGGGRNIVEWLRPMLEEQGHQVEIIYFPQNDDPDLIFQQMLAIRWMDLEVADRIICFRPQSHLIPHPHKILWFIHHIRIFYDLWDSPYRGFPDDFKHRGIREALYKTDNAALGEAKAIFTNSRVVSNRLKKYNGIDSEVLYPPVYKPEQFFCDGYNDEIVFISRLEHHKRQHLLVEALKLTRTAVRIRFFGTGSGPEYPNHLLQRISELGLSDRVQLENKWIGDDEKISMLSRCLAAAYIPLDEDSYGYPSVEASLSSKAVITTTDSGGVLELIEDGSNGLVVDPTPEALAEAMDRLYLDRVKAKEMGINAFEKLAELNISWPHVISRLLA